MHDASPMALRPVTLRLEPDLLDLVEREAQRKGISAAEFMRTAILSRVVFCYARRGETAAGFEALYRAADVAVRAYESGM